MFSRGGFVARFAGDHGLGVVPRRGAADRAEAVGDFPGFLVASQHLKTKKGPEAGEGIA